MNEETIATQFACSRPTKTLVETLHDNHEPRGDVDDYADKVQEMYETRRKGMLPGLD